MKNTISIGNAGEYFVAGELERRGFTVAVPMSNVELFDLLIFDRISKNQFAIQVKTTHSNKKEWLMHQKNENISSKNIFYILFCMNNLSLCEYHIVPSDFVARSIAQNHQKWLNTPTKKGKQHRDTTMRKFEDFENQFLNRWDLLQK